MTTEIYAGFPLSSSINLDQVRELSLNDGIRITFPPFLPLTCFLFTGPHVHTMPFCVDRNFYLGFMFFL